MEQTARSWDENPVLAVEHLTMRFGGLVAVNDLSFSIGRGDITALSGQMALAKQPSSTVSLVFINQPKAG